MMHFEPLDHPDRQKFKILQIQSAAGILTKLRYLGNGLNNLVTFQYSLNIFKQYMYITTSTEKRIRYSGTMRTIQYGLVNSAMGQMPCSTERISS